MGPVGLPSHNTRPLAGLAVGLSGVESSSLPRYAASLAVAADEKVYRLLGPSVDGLPRQRPLYG